MRKTVITIIRQICKILPTAMGLSVSVCVCLSVCLLLSWAQIELWRKSKYKHGVDRFWHLPSNGVIAKILLRDLDEIFKVKLLKWLFWQVNTGKCKRYYCHQIGILVFAIEWRNCECCTSWPWPTFSRSLILNVNILKTVRASVNAQIWLYRGWY